MHADPNMQPRESELLEVMPSAITLFDLAEKDFEEALPDFAAQRMAKLSEGVSTEFMTNATKGTDEFVRPERPQQVMGIMTKAFLMDDPSLYTTLIWWTRQQFLQTQGSNPEYSEDKTYVSAALQGTLIGQWEYFGSYVGNAEQLISSTADLVFIDFDPENDAASEDGAASKYASIADVRTAAVCQQRALATHNTFRILGLDSKYKVGKLSEVINGEPDEAVPHAYVELNWHDKQRFLIDPTNPILWRDANGNVTWLSPQITEIPEGSATLDTVLSEVVADANGTRQLQNTHNLRYIFDQAA